MKKIWMVGFVAGNPEMFSNVTYAADGPFLRSKAIETATMLADHGWRSWVEHRSDPSWRIYESDAELTHKDENPPAP